MSKKTPKIYKIKGKKTRKRQRGGQEKKKKPAIGETKPKSAAVPEPKPMAKPAPKPATAPSPKPATAPSPKPAEPKKEEPETIMEASEGFLGEMFEDVEDIFEPVTDAVAESTKEITTAATNATAKAIADSTDYVLDTLVGEELLKKTPDEITEEVKVKAEKVAEVSKDLVTDPSLNDVLQSVGEDVGEMTKKVIHAAEEPLVQGTEAAMDTAEKVLEKAGRGLVNTTLAASEGVIGEIPVVGGVMDLILAFGKGINTATATFRGAIDNSEKFVTLANNVVGDGLDLANEGVDKYKDTKAKSDGVYEKIVGSINKATETVKGMEDYKDKDVEKEAEQQGEGDSVTTPMKGGRRKRNKTKKNKKKGKKRTMKKRKKTKRKSSSR